MVSCPILSNLSYLFYLSYLSYLFYLSYLSFLSFLSYLSIYPSIHPSVHLSICQSVYLPTCLQSTSICTCICISHTSIRHGQLTDWFSQGCPSVKGTWNLGTGGSDHDALSAMIEVPMWLCSICSSFCQVYRNTVQLTEKTYQYRRLYREMALVEYKCLLLELCQA